MTNEDLTSQPPHEPKDNFRPSSAAKVGLITATLTAFGIVFVTTHQLLLLLLTYGAEFLRKEEVAHPIFTSQSFTLSFLPFAAGVLTAAFALFASVSAWKGNKKLGGALSWTLLPALLLTAFLGREITRTAFTVPVFILGIIATACLFASEYRRSTAKLVVLSLAFLALSVPAAAAAEHAVFTGYESRVGERVLNKEVARIFNTGVYHVSVDQSFSSTEEIDKNMTEATFDFSDCTEKGEGNNSTEWLRVNGKYYYNVDREGWLRDDVNPSPVGPLLWALMPSSEQSLANDYGVCKGLQQLANVATVSSVLTKGEGKTYVLHFDRRRAESAADRRSWEVATEVLGLSGVPAIIINQIATPAFGAFFNAKPEIQVDVDKNGSITEMRTLLDKKGTIRTIERYTFAAAKRPSIKTPDHQNISLRVLLDSEEYLSLIKE